MNPMKWRIRPHYVRLILLGIAGLKYKEITGQRRRREFFWDSRNTVLVSSRPIVIDEADDTVERSAFRAKGDANIKPRVWLRTKFGEKVDASLRDQDSVFGCRFAGTGFIFRQPF
jgi:hypothetical protein